MEKAVNRILDANLNRSREALRVMEDYARFVLDDAQLSGQLKEARAQLRSAVQLLGGQCLLSARNTPGDVGTELTSPAEMDRPDTAAVVTAACKRVAESLRVLEEFSKTVNAQAAKMFEQLRYHCYDWEQRLLSRGRARGLLSKMRLYVLITSSLCRKHPLDVTKDVLDAGADCLQLREKDMAVREYAELAASTARMCREAGTLFIVNDRPDIAVAVGADGVHLGQEDVPVAQARKVLSGEMIVGVSTHNIEQARQAAADGADYIGVGPVFATGTKPSAQPVGLDYVRQAASEIDLPMTAIGGITLDNVGEVIAAGARCVAVCSAIISSDDPGQAASEFVKRLST